MPGKEELEKIEKQRKEWEEETLAKALKRFRMEESGDRFYSPLDVKDFDFSEKVGFPGEYPFTSGIYASAGPQKGMMMGAPSSMVRAGMYSGYGTAENTRDYYKGVQARGFPGGPNMAFDLPTQIGLDSDDPRARGEVGKVGVAIDTLRDFEVVYEAFTDGKDLDKIASNWTVNPTANIILAMYIALAEKRGIPQEKLRGTPQNEILKEILARGTQIFPIKPSMRLTRDTIVYCDQNMPLMNTLSVSGYHTREAGGSREQALAFTLSNGIAYVQLGIDAGLNVDSFVHRMTFLSFCGGGMEILKEIAAQRAGRRMWAKIMRERFGAKDPRSWIARISSAMIGNYSTTAQRPLNNLTRAVLGGVAGAMCGGIPAVFPPYDEPMQLGWSQESMQLSQDAMRIIHSEAKLCDVIDPFAGSYYMEFLTDQIEAETWEIIKKIDDMGGMVAALEKGWPQRELAKSAHEFQHQIETGEKMIVGVNAFVGEQELEVETQRMVPDPYDPQKRAQAEEQQLASLAEVKRGRDEQAVEEALRRLKEVASDENANTIPPLVEAVKAYATVGEMTKTLKEVFGEFRDYGGL